MGLIRPCRGGDGVKPRSSIGLRLHKGPLLQPQDSRKEGLQIEWREGSETRHGQESLRQDSDQPKE